MDRMKIWEQWRRKVLLDVVVYVACLLALISICIRSGYLKDLMAEDEDDTNHEESDEAESTSVEQSVREQAPPPSTSSSRGLKRKAPSVDSLSEAIDKIGEAMKMIAGALSEANRVVEASQRPKYIGKQVFAELQKLELDGNNLLFKAFIHIMKDEKRVDALFGCPDEMRKELVLLMLDEQS